jgi:hypothetical protein
MRFNDRRYYLVVIKGKKFRPDVLEVYAVATRKAALDDVGYLRRAGHNVEARKFGEVITR